MCVATVSCVPYAHVPLALRRVVFASTLTHFIALVASRTVADCWQSIHIGAAPTAAHDVVEARADSPDISSD